MLLEVVKSGHICEKVRLVIFAVRNKAGVVLTIRLLRLPRPEVIYLCPAMLVAALHSTE